MNLIGNENKIPLTEQETSLLTEIYNKRRRLFASAFSVLIIMGIIYGIRIDERASGHAVRFSSDKTDLQISRAVIMLTGVSFLEIPILSVGTFIYIRRIRSLARDIWDGFKYCTYFTVVDKLHFPMTGQYFVSLNNADYLHHEVDAGVFEMAQAGGPFPVYFTRHARYAFNMNGRYTIL